MKKRSPTAVFFLSIITLFIYSWYWDVKTKGEMNKLGEKIPTAWIWLIPFVGSIWWYWKYSEGVEHVTHKELNGVLAFILLMLLPIIGQAIIQDFFNKIEPSVATVPASPMTSQQAGVVTSGQPTSSVAPTSNPQAPSPTPPN